MSQTEEIVQEPVKQSILTASRPNIKSPDLPGVPNIDDFVQFDLWLRTFWQFISVNVNHYVGESIRLNRLVRPPQPEQPEGGARGVEKAIFEEQVKHYVKELADYQKDFLKSYSIMIGQMSIGSEELIKRETPNFEDEVHNDVLKLIQAYRQTHRPMSIGVAKADQYQAEKRFALFKMGDLTIDEFNVAFDANIANLKSLKAIVPDEEKLVLIYFDKLDPVRYGDFIVNMSNGVLMKSLEYPTELKEAKRLVSQYKVTVSYGRESGSKAVFSAKVVDKVVARKPCFAFQEGNCRYGNRCKFIHDMSEHKVSGVRKSTYGSSELMDDKVVLFKGAESSGDEVRSKFVSFKGAESNGDEVRSKFSGFARVVDEDEDFDD